MNNFKVKIALWICLLLALSTSVNADEECQADFEKVLTDFGKDYEPCFTGFENFEGCDFSEGAFTPADNLVILLDASGSMAAQIDGRSKMAIAKEIIVDFMTKINPETNVSLVVYGHKGNNQPDGKQESCEGIEEIYSLGPVNETELSEKVKSFEPRGYTPIATAMSFAAEILHNANQADSQNLALLVSDGKETCDGDPVNTAKELIARDVKLLTHVIGFDVEGEDAQQLQAIAQASGGNYYSAQNSESLREHFDRTEEQWVCGHAIQSWHHENRGQVMDTVRECRTRIMSETRAARDRVKKSNSENDGYIKEGCHSFVKDAYSEREHAIRERLEEHEHKHRDLMLEIEKRSRDQSKSHD